MDGYTSTIIAVLFLGGVQLISVGILGEYIGRIYDEVKRRPLFLIQDVHRVQPRTQFQDTNPPVAALANLLKQCESEEISSGV